MTETDAALLAPKGGLASELWHLRQFIIDQHGKIGWAYVLEKAVVEVERYAARIERLENPDMRNALVLSIHEAWHHTRPKQRRDIVRFAIDRADAALRGAP